MTLKTETYIFPYLSNYRHIPLYSLHIQPCIFFFFFNFFCIVKCKSTSIYTGVGPAFLFIFFFAPGAGIQKTGGRGEVGWSLEAHVHVVLAYARCNENKGIGGAFTYCNGYHLY
jgi:hypothetical protein